MPKFLKDESDQYTEDFESLTNKTTKKSVVAKPVGINII
jgi:hypothetical protein